MSFFERAREFRGGGGSSVRRSGRVRASGHSLADDGGEWNALYCSLFCGGWAYANDLQRFDEAMQTLADSDIDAWRAIGVLGGVSWQDRMVSTTPLTQWVDAHLGAARRGWKEFGRRCAFTIFGGQDNGADSPEKRRRIVEAVAEMVNGEEDHYLYLEVFNEAYDENMTSAEVRALGEWLQTQTAIPVALSTPSHVAAHEPGSAKELYENARVQALTFHVDRKTDDGPAEPIWNYYETLYFPNAPALRFNNEPPDQYASLFADHEPRRITARAVLTWEIGSGYCWHPGPGKRLGGSWEPHIPAKLADTDGFMATVSGFRSMRRVLPAGMSNAEWWAGHMGDNPVGTVRRKDYDDGGLFKGFTVRMPNGRLIDLRLGVKRDVEMTTPQALTEVDLITGEPIRTVSGTYRLDPSRPETLFVGVA